MGSARRVIDPGHRGRGQWSVKQALCDAVLQQVLERVQAAGYEDRACDELRNHFASLPARYALNVDPMREDDVLLHMRLLMEAREAEANAYGDYSDYHPLPQVHVRRVVLSLPAASPGRANSSPGSEMEDEEDPRSRGIPIPGFPKPAFGSNLNLAGMAGSSGSPSSFSARGLSSSPASVPAARHGMRFTPPSRSSNPLSLPTPPFRNTPPQRSTPPGPWRPPRPRGLGSFTSLSEMDEDDSCDSREDPPNAQWGWEITVATADRHGLLKYLTMALCTSGLELNIKEAHVFSSTDGMALEVFVVEGWNGDDPEELQQAVLDAINKKLGEAESSPMEISKEVQLADWRAAVEAMNYEDWAVDFNDVTADWPSEPRVEAETERGQGQGLHKQGMGPLRFIGACSCWPKLCIVTELMAGGSVRDVILNRGSGLEPPAAIKVLRDAARGMDFLHKRGVVHRDLKAANLLIDEHDVVKVCDFGVARMKPQRVAAAGVGVGMAVGGPTDPTKGVEMTAETGTYRWMAPEVLEHRPYDHKADVYSFGIMIWEILTGGIPYAGLTPLQAAIGVVQRGLRPQMPPQAPQRLVALAERCWHFNPDERPEFSEILAFMEEHMRPATFPQRGNYHFGYQVFCGF
eukprot:jgi/Mesen1/10693/ME000090S10153